MAMVPVMCVGWAWRLPNARDLAGVSKLVSSCDAKGYGSVAAKDLLRLMRGRAADVLFMSGMSNLMAAMRLQVGGAALPTWERRNGLAAVIRGWMTKRGWSEQGPWSWKLDAGDDLYGPNLEATPHQAAKFKHL